MFPAEDIEELQDDFRVGAWIARTRLNRLDRWGESGSQRHIEPRTMELLRYLAARPRQVVPREEILRDVWKGGSSPPRR